MNADAATTGFTCRTIHKHATIARNTLAVDADEARNAPNSCTQILINKPADAINTSLVIGAISWRAFLNGDANIVETGFVCFTCTWRYHE